MENHSAMNTPRTRQPFVCSMMLGTPHAIAFSKTHALRCRLDGNSKPFSRWACERSWREGRAVGPPTAAGWPLAPLPKLCFGSRSIAGAPLSFITSRRSTPALKGLRNTAQGQPSLSEATLGMATHDREANPVLPSHAALTSSVPNVPPLPPVGPAASKTRVPHP